VRCPHLSSVDTASRYPYEVTCVILNAVELKLPRTLQIHPVVNVSRVKPYLDPLPGQPVSRPGPVHVSEEHNEEYEVDYIVASRMYKRQLQYLVHWKGYEDHERTWEPSSNLKNSPLVVEHFYRENPSAPQKLHMTQADFNSLFSPIPENLMVCDARSAVWNPAPKGGVVLQTKFLSYLILVYSRILST